MNILPLTSPFAAAKSLFAPKVARPTTADYELVARIGQQADQLSDLSDAELVTVTAGLRERVLDGGLVDNIPLRLADQQPGDTLVLLSRRYERTLPDRPGVVWAQPSRPIRIDKFDYANPDGLQETFDLGVHDGRRFART